jgi:hypothetical protein
MRNQAAEGLWRTFPPKHSLPQIERDDQDAKANRSGNGFERNVDSSEDERHSPRPRFEEHEPHAGPSQAQNEIDLPTAKADHPQYKPQLTPLPDPRRTIRTSETAIRSVATSDCRFGF